jgi:hypothetical protein
VSLSFSELIKARQNSFLLVEHVEAKAIEKTEDLQSAQILWYQV